MKGGNMKNWRITGIFIILIIGFLLMCGCTSTGSTSSAPVATPTTSVISPVVSVVTKQPIIPTTTIIETQSTLITPTKDPNQPLTHDDITKIQVEGRLALERQQCMAGLGNLDDCYKVAVKNGMANSTMKAMWCRTNTC